MGEENYLVRGLDYSLMKTKLSSYTHIVDSYHLSAELNIEGGKIDLGSLRAQVKQTYGTEWRDSRSLD